MTSDRKNIGLWDWEVRSFRHGIDLKLSNVVKTAGEGHLMARRRCKGIELFITII